jgi:Tfp pilus assembly protein PilF
MAASNENADRRVVPRWRTFQQALATNELSAASIATASTIDVFPFLHEKEDSWLRNKTIPFALDLVSAATVLGPSKHANAAAEMLLEAKTKINPTARSLAQGLLGITEVPVAREITSADVVTEISLLKRKRIAQKRNAFVWTDLARLYAAVGQNESASRALRVALTLAPSDRFVLRCTTRFLLHDREPEKAFALLQKSQRTPEDPWLMAAEIAVSSVLNKPSKFAKLGSQLLKHGDLPPFHTSELASALASLEMFSGNDRRANRLFRSALVDPTDNALAQTIWASKRTGLGNVDISHLEKPNLNEPRALDYFNRFNWKETVHFAEAWARDESFSARPRLLASAIATTFLHENKRAERVAREGLATNPGHPGLINNIAFALIDQGKPAEALQTIDTVDRNLVTVNEAICLMATVGLAYFRLGETDRGRESYENAISAAFQNQNQYLRMLARLYLAREEVRTGTAGAREQFAAVCNDARKLDSTNLPVIADHLTKQIEGIEGSPR